MEALSKEREALHQKGNLQRPISDTQNMIDRLKEARSSIAADPTTAPLSLAKLNSTVKSSFQRFNEVIKEAHNGQRDYGKALGNKFKDKPPAFAENDALTSQTSLINRAIAMHLLREGHFDVATTFIAEANAKPPTVHPTDTDGDNTMANGDGSRQSEYRLDAPQLPAAHKSWESDFSPSAYKSANLQQQFSEMYHILHELRERQNLTPAIEWARQHSAVLESRGSNLEYDLCVLQYVTLLRSDQPPPLGGVAAAVAYARKTFPQFPLRYMAQSQALFGALPFASNIGASPYATRFSADSSSSIYANDTGSTTAAAAASAFTAEFCALLSLSSASPLLTAVTAGCTALPTLLKLSQIQALHRTSWTTASELPVEVPLPPAFQFHSVFVCPVSKEQSTDANPPMMMPCGHLVAKESLEKLSRGTRFKCPYCPAESNPSQAKMVFL